MRIILSVLVLLGALFTTATPAHAANAVMERTKGKILLDVEGKGEAWYVSPVSGFRYWLGTPKEAFNVMRMLGLGISAGDLGRVVSADESGATHPSMMTHVGGRILLDVSRDGAAWYVDPDTGHRYPLGTPTEAFRVMSERGLGISRENLALIPVGALRGPFVRHEAAFVPQAPFGEWWDQRQDEGCEETTALMAVNWARGGGAIDYADAKERILGAAEQQRERYGSFQDTSVADTAQRIFREYFGFDAIEVKSGIGANDIVAALNDGHVVAVGVNARKLGNPWYSDPQPLQHMVLVLGYDPLADEFTVHDPGTRRGEAMRFDATVFEGALLDYPSGYREAIVSRPASMIVVSKDAAPLAATR